VIFGDVIAEQSKGSYIYSSSRLVTVLGIENLIVVETKDAVLVAHQDKSQEIKKLLNS
jgi:mannose-1-phosphate guanylyltransferase